MTILDIWEPQDVPDTLEGVRNLFAGDPATGRRRHRTRAGEVLEVSVATRTLVFAGRRALLAIVDDFTDRHRRDSPAITAIAAGSLADLPSGSETLLVIEDDPALRSLTCTMLESGGYTVFAEQTAAAAIAFAELHAGPIHLVLTDVVMPGMNGAEVAARLAALRPAARLLYMSGYTGEVLGRRGLLSPDTALLEKPFNQRDLLRKVRELLDTPPRS